YGRYNTDSSRRAEREISGCQWTLSRRRRTQADLRRGGMPDSLRLLHLPDLHFGGYTDEKGTWHNTHSFDSPERLAKILTEDKECKPSPEVVIVSGDIVWSASKEEYDHALRFFAALRNEWPEVRWVLAAGNHDVQWKVPNDKQQDEFLAFCRKLYGAD